MGGAAAGHYDDALDILERSLPATQDLAWYYYLKALAHLAQGDVTAALDDFRSVTEEHAPPEWRPSIERAVAALVLGDATTAQRVLDGARNEPDADAQLVSVCAALIALAADDLHAAGEVLREAAVLLGHPRELEEIERDLRLLLPLLGDDGTDLAARRQFVTEVLTEEVSRHQARLQEQPPSGGTELARELRRRDRSGRGPELDAAMVALLAVASRRQALAGDQQGAADGYQRLCSSTFEPEAGIALTRMLSQISGEYASQGDVEGVKNVEDRLDSIGSGGVVQQGLAVASAMEATGHLTDARDELASLRPDIGDDSDRQDVHRRRGELALFTGDAPAATEELTLALTVATRQGTAQETAQLEIRLSVAAALTGEVERAAGHLVAALDGLRTAGAYAPLRLLADELRRLLSASPDGDWKQRVRPLLQAAFEQLENHGELSRHSRVDTEALHGLLSPEGSEPDRSEMHP